MNNSCHPIKPKANYLVQKQNLTLKQIPQHTGFKIPEGYLEHFKVDFNRELSPPSVRPARIVAFWALAACIIFLLGYFVLLTNESVLDREEIAIYLLEETDVDVYELVESFGLEPFADQYIIQNQSIENYLIEETNYFNEFITTP